MDPKDMDPRWDPDHPAFWEEDDDSRPEIPRPAWLKRLVRIGAIVILIAFAALSYAWLPQLSPRLAFLEQNQNLARDSLVASSREAVVQIRAVKSSGPPGSASSGTGFNAAPQGMIITNRHVVEGALSVKITFPDQQSYFSDRVEVMTDADIAVIHLNEQQLPFLPISLDTPVEKEQTVTIIGNPLGIPQVAVRGPVTDYYRGSNGTPVVFGINAPIEAGSSGSPVLDEQGRVVGVVYAVHTPPGDTASPQEALAIPAAYLKSIMAPVSTAEPQ